MLRATLLASVALLSAAATAQDLEYRGTPQVLGRNAPRVYEWVPDLAFTNVAGQGASLSDVAGEAGLVIAMRDPECPLSKKYSPRLKQLEATLEELGLGLLYVGSESTEVAAKDVKTYGLGGAYAVDPKGVIAGNLEARTSTEVFVLDAARTLVYRGMIDDQYGLGFNRPEVKNTYLLDAVRAVAAGEQVAVHATVAQGCLLEPAEAEPLEREVTYHEDISRIVQSRCQSCHHEGAVGPFPLMDYQDVKKRRSMLAWVIEDGIMPPWFADEESGPWANDCSLTDSERENFLTWLDGGTPEGDPANAPLERQWATGWTIGEPDLIVAMPEEFAVPADGVVDYQYFYAKTELPEDKWIQAVEIRPGAASVVHHVLIFIEEPEILERMNQGDREAARQFQGGGRGYFAGTVPGQSGLVYPEGCGKILPAGAWLKFQVHYTTTGTAAVDRSEVAFIFSDEPSSARSAPPPRSTSASPSRRTPSTTRSRATTSSASRRRSCRCSPTPTCAATASTSSCSTRTAVARTS